MTVNDSCLLVDQLQVLQPPKVLLLQVLRVPKWPCLPRGLPRHRAAGLSHRILAVRPVAMDQDDHHQHHLRNMPYERKEVVTRWGDRLLASLVKAVLLRLAPLNTPRHCLPTSANNHLHAQPNVLPRNPGCPRCP